MDQNIGRLMNTLQELGIDEDTVVMFLSEEIPHEVKPAQRDRYSVTGWFRLNSSSPDRVDPPR